MPTIINTIFPVTQGFGVVPTNARPPFSPGSSGTNNTHPAGTEANAEAPGVGLPAQSPAFKRSPSSTSSPNQTEGGAVAPGVGDTNDSPVDDSNEGSGNGPIDVLEVGTALGRADGGLQQPGGAGRNVVDDRIATQVLGVGTPQNVNGGRT